MSNKIKFGTDGWRAVIARDYTFENVRRAAHGFARFLTERYGADQKVVVGYDTRFQSEHFASKAAEVMASYGFSVLLTECATPTPVISYAVLAQQAVGALNITASHNPPVYNGFKVRSPQGGAIASEDLTLIESLIPESPDITIPHSKGEVKKFDPSVAYIDHLKNLVDLQAIRATEVRLAVDCMWGNGAGWFPRLLGGGKIQITECHNLRNPVFPGMERPEPIPPNTAAGLTFSKSQNADLLIINDGDADRIGLGDENGEFINQFNAFGLIAWYMLEFSGKKGPIVKSLSSTVMVEKLARQYKAPVHITGVGFKNIAPKMVETDALLGGEESGGYAFRDHVPERDGILAGLYILDLMRRTGLTPTQLVDELFRRVGRHFYDRVDVPVQTAAIDVKTVVANANPSSIAGMKVIRKDAWDGFQFHLEDGGWLLIRFSGTEPVIRFYCETSLPGKTAEILREGLHLAGLGDR